MLVAINLYQKVILIKINLKIISFLLKEIIIRVKLNLLMIMKYFREFWMILK